MNDDDTTVPDDQPSDEEVLAAVAEFETETEIDPEDEVA